MIGGSGLKEQVVHVTRLRKYHQRDDPYEGNTADTPAAADQKAKVTHDTTVPALEENKESGETKYPDPIPIEDTHVPVTIVS